MAYDRDGSASMLVEIVKRNRQVMTRSDMYYTVARPHNGCAGASFFEDSNQHEYLDKWLNDGYRMTITLPRVIVAIIITAALVGKLRAQAAIDWTRTVGFAERGIATGVVDVSDGYLMIGISGN